MQIDLQVWVPRLSKLSRTGTQRLPMWARMQGNHGPGHRGWECAVDESVAPWWGSCQGRQGSPLSTGGGGSQKEKITL